MFWRRQSVVFGRPFVKRFDVYAIGPLSVLSRTLVYCGQTAARIKMPLRTEVGLGPGHIVLDENPAPPKGAQPLFCRGVAFAP